VDALAVDKAKPKAKEGVEQMMTPLARVCRISFGNRRQPFHQPQIAQGVQVITTISAWDDA
jgi:hypothetical protein